MDFVFQTLVTADRASLLNDAFSLADSGELNYEIALDMIGYLKREVEYVPWAVGTDIANGLLKYLPDLPELKVSPFIITFDGLIFVLEIIFTLFFSEILPRFGFGRIQ